MNSIETAPKKTKKKTAFLQVIYKQRQQQPPTASVLCFIDYKRSAKEPVPWVYTVCVCVCVHPQSPWNRGLQTPTKPDRSGDAKGGDPDTPSAPYIRDYVGCLHQDVCSPNISQSYFLYFFIICLIDIIIWN